MIETVGSEARNALYRIIAYIIKVRREEGEEGEDCEDTAGV